MRGRLLAVAVVESEILHASHADDIRQANSRAARHDASLRAAGRAAFRFR